MGETTSLSELLPDILEAAEGQNDATVRDLVDACGSRAYGPLILTPAIITLSPVGAVPFVPTFTGVLILLISIQLFFGKKSPWIPDSLLNRGIKREKIKQSTEKIQPWIEWSEKFIKPRLSWLFEGIAVRFVGLICCALASCMPLLEIIPFAASLPALGIALQSVALTTKDGLYYIFGVFISAGTGYAVYQYAL